MYVFNVFLCIFYVCIINVERMILTLGNKRRKTARKRIRRGK